MKNNSFVDFVVKNKYIIICVSVVVLLLITGLLGFVLKALAIVLLLALAVYIGKKMQDDSSYLKKLFDLGKQKVTYKIYDDEDKKDGNIK